MPGAANGTNDNVDNMTHEPESEWREFKRRSEAAGKCPYSGLEFRRCKGTDLCDCFDYPQFEHWRL